MSVIRPADPTLPEVLNTIVAGWPKFARFSTLKTSNRSAVAFPTPQVPPIWQPPRIRSAYPNLDTRGSSQTYPAEKLCRTSSENPKSRPTS